MTEPKSHSNKHPLNFNRVFCLRIGMISSEFGPQDKESVTHLLLFLANCMNIVKVHKMMTLLSSVRLR